MIFLGIKYKFRRLKNSDIFRNEELTMYEEGYGGDSAG